MSFIVLLFILSAEIIFRLVIEIREWRLFNKKIPFAFFRCVPILNDFFPFPENIHKEKKSSRFIDAHEQAHKKLHHKLLRNLLKLCFYSLMVLLIVILLGEWRFSLLEIVLWFHVALGIFRLFYHRICWNQEEEADKLARDSVGKNEAKRELSKLEKAENPSSLLFAFLYKEHPPAFSRRMNLN